MASMIEERSELRRALLEFTVDHLNDPVVVLDSRGRAVGANQAAIERSALELLEGLESSGPLAQFWAELEGSGRATVEVPSPESAGARWTVSAFRVSTGFVLHARDAAPEAGALDGEPRRRLESLGLLTASIVHDLNNLLAPILLLTGALRRAPISQVQDVAREIEVTTGKAMELTRRALALVRPRKSHLERVNVGDVVRESRGLMERVVGEAVQLNLEIGPNLPDALLDRERLLHALLNLAANARDAMPNGGKLTVRVAHVVPGGGEAGEAASDYVSLTVADTGTGMSSDVRARLFERFFTTKSGHGTGLGLAAVRSFVADAQGLISVWSRPHCGTVVALFFPRARRNERPTLRAIPKPGAA
jgi:signal transduction histidine kinase